jgi:Fe-S oxidoreductase
VFWGFVAFGGYTAVEALRGLGIADATGSTAFRTYRLVLVPFATAVLIGIVGLAVRRVVVRPIGLGAKVSGESVVIASFIAVLMVTFLLEFAVGEGTAAARVNWWTHMLVIFAFLALIPASKHLHLVLSPATVLLKSPELGRIENLDFEKEEVGLEVVGDLSKKMALDAFTCVECGRCQVNCPAWGAGKELNPKALILQSRQALLANQREARLGEVYSEKVLWQCTTCGACENQCPVGIEHVPLVVGSRRGLVSNGEAPGYLAGLYNNLERRRNIWGLGYDERQKFVDAAGLERFDAGRHEWLVWLGCAGAFESDYQKSLRSLFEILRAQSVTFGVLQKEVCTGDAAKRTGNEYIFQELAQANLETLRGSGARKILTSCPHCVKTLGDDYGRFGYQAEVVHSSVFVAKLAPRMRTAEGPAATVTFHDPCYLGRYGGHVDEPRELLVRSGADVREPERNRDNPYCCGAGGGLLFADKEEEPGSRISDVRFGQLQKTGAGTVVTACPFCSIMLKGADPSGGTETEFVDLMTFVRNRLS